ncbi:hypothetical protein ASF30_11835 [Leifsonia sp. Leaf264]|nr:hypothetical protein ASF30_11835 [Leifsonia sp. Leaf264]
MCRNKVPAGSNRCDECTALILNHPDSRVRRALIREDGIDETVLIQLSGDPDFSVALAAETRLEQLDEDSQNTTHTGADPWANL